MFFSFAPFFCTLFGAQVVLDVENTLPCNHSISTYPDTVAWKIPGPILGAMPEKIENLGTQQAEDVLPPSSPPTDGGVSDADDEIVEIPLPPPTTMATQTLDVDLKTPDSHVPRDPRFIRLTGVHPFKVEVPLTGHPC